MGGLLVCLIRFTRVIDASKAQTLYVRICNTPLLPNSPLSCGVEKREPNLCGFRSVAHSSTSTLSTFCDHLHERETRRLLTYTRTRPRIL